MKTTLLLFFVSAAMMFSSCGDSEQSIDDLIAKGGKKYGGELSFMSTDKISSLFPTYAADVYSARINSQIYEPLMEYDMETMNVIPAIAESFTVDSEAKVYTFTIREGVKFHKDECFGGGTGDLTVEDVKFSFDLACSGLEKNQISYLLKNHIKGAEDYIKKSTASIPSGGIPSVKIIGSNQVQVTLSHSFPGFEKIVANSNLSIISKIAFEKYGNDIENHPIGSGPFALESKSEDKIILVRNPSYWKKDDFGNQLPFLSKVNMTYSKDKKSELSAFKDGKMDLVLEIPVDEIQNILGTLQEAQDGKNVKHKVDSRSSLSMTYIAMACESEEFSDVHVRKAFNLAINREQVVDNWLEGEGWPAIYGFVPTIGAYDNKKVKGHNYAPDRAKALLTKAGYPNGKGFPVLEFYVNAKEGSSMHTMAKAVQKQLKDNLNIDLAIKLCTIEEREEAIASGKAKIWRSAWIADYPDAENFLSLFYGGNVQETASMVNSFRFHNEEFDALFEKASSETNNEKRMQYLTKCDQIIVDEAAAIPMLTDDHIVMVNARIRDFSANTMETLVLKEVFIKELKKN
ncbi:MAG: ABC transporter substrate-binding protein [Crocinitomicaceae bacterium]|nr:ABC transporter substrate-binding protein [Crocinitomicaceae bacterium]